MITLRPHQQSALDKIADASKGQIIVPTGGGKTLIAIMDAVRLLNASVTPQTIVVVAPRILLANQLCEEYMEVIKDEVANQVIPAHIHSGDTSHFSTTKVEEIKCFEGMMETAGLHRIYFTTYHSLSRLAQAGISVSTIYFDEAHNSVQKSFYPATQYFSETAKRCYFFTATPKHSATIKKPGMNNVSVYGNVIVNVAAPKLVQGGFIVPPRIVARELPLITKKEQTSERDSEYVLQSIRENNASKVLVCAKSVKQITRMISESDFTQQLQDAGYSYMYISASTGAVVDGKKVNSRRSSSRPSMLGVKITLRSSWFSTTLFSLRESMFLVWKQLYSCVIWTSLESAKQSVALSVSIRMMLLVFVAAPLLRVM